MWHTPLGTMVLTGPFAVLMAKGILYVVEDVSNCLEYDDDDCMVDYGYPAFDTLTTEQKAWVLHRIAFGLFDPDTEPVGRAVYSDAAIDAAYRHFEVNLQTEWEDGKLGAGHTLRHLVLECVEQEQRHQPEDAKRPPMAIECKNWKQWENALDDLRMIILQDKDHIDVKWQDLSSKQRAKGMKILGIDEDYFTMIPGDPSKKEAMRLLKEAERICSDVIDRYE